MPDDPERAFSIRIDLRQDDRDRYRALFRPPTTYADGNPIIKLPNGPGYNILHNITGDPNAKQYTMEDRYRYAALYDVFPMPPKSTQGNGVEIELNTKVGVNDTAIMTKGHLDECTDVTEKLKCIFDDPGEVITQSFSRSQTLGRDNFNNDKDRISKKESNFLKSLVAPGGRGPGSR
jgi:hypothetical protein